MLLRIPRSARMPVYSVYNPPGGGGGGTGDVDLTSLPTSAAADTTAYTALNVPAMAAGTVFSDPVTGTRTVKLSSSGANGGLQFWPVYSTQGLSISQAWGAGLDQYTILLVGSGSTYLVDYQIGGTSSNYRTVPNVGASGNHAFSRKAGEERILYIHTGSQLRRYDTSANAYADTGVFPISWSISGVQWLMINNAHTYASARASSGAVLYGANLTTGATFTKAVASIDDVYMGYNNVAFVNSTREMWDLSTNTLTSIGALPPGPPEYTSPGHCPSMRGYWPANDANTGGGTMRWLRIYEDGTVSPTVVYPRYWGQSHMSGHWWDQPAGDSQWFLWSSYQAG
jgi:hypothetical protein